MSGVTNILAGSLTTGAATLADRQSNVKGNVILIESVVGGSAHVNTDFDNHIVNVTLRNGVPGGRDKQLIKNARFGDLLKLSDHKGGFSTDLEAADGTNYVAAVPIGFVDARGNDVLEVSVKGPGDATATYAYRIGLSHTADGPELLYGYETLTGQGDDVAREKVVAVYLCTAYAGNSIHVEDYMGGGVQLDQDIIALGNAMGQMESYENFGPVYIDPTGFGQPIQVTVPSSAYMLVQTRFFDGDRFAVRGQQADARIKAVLEQIGADDPEQLAIIQKLGR